VRTIAAKVHTVTCNVHAVDECYDLHNRLYIMFQYNEL
jgi:hypothetical protein